MSQIKHVFSICNKKLDGIWAESEPDCREKVERQPESGRQAKNGPATWRIRHFVYDRKWELLFILLMGALLFYLAWILPFDGGPDEKARYLIPTYIYHHGTLPAGWDPEIRNPIWGISYAFHPILPYIFGGYLMKLVGIFNSSDHALLMAARFVNVVLGMGFYWYVVQIAKKLFKNKLFRVYFIALLALLPQLLYLFVYVNTDGIALFSSAMIINYWLVGLERKWDRGSCTGLAVGVSLCALSYFNAYGYALFAVILFVGSLVVFYGKRGAGRCVTIILKRGIYITVIVCLLTGWWFIRCAILYDGDFLGLNAPGKYAELYAQEEYKPSVKKSLQEQGISMDEMLRTEEEGGMEWKRTTYRSTIGYFGYYEYPLGLDIYEIHKRLLILGAAGILMYTGFAFFYYIGEKLRLPVRRRGLAAGIGHQELPHHEPMTGGPGRREILKTEVQVGASIKMHPANFLLLQFSFICCIIIPVILSLYYSYTDDFQPQGRYIMPLIIPVMYFTAAGTERLMRLVFRKWIVWILMIPLFYGVLHVFLGAFISVYIPSFVEPLAFLADIRFPWFSNQGWLMKLVMAFLPG